MTWSIRPAITAVSSDYAPLASNGGASGASSLMNMSRPGEGAIAHVARIREKPVNHEKIRSVSKIPRRYDRSV